MDRNTKSIHKAMDRAPIVFRTEHISARARLLTMVLAVFFVASSLQAQDQESKDVPAIDFSTMPIEELMKQEMTVRQRLEGTRKLTLQDGILGGHVHESGEWMVGYKHMFMDMNGNRSGSNRVSTADVFAQGFVVSPTAMTMEMDMVHLMHAPSDEFTWMVMVPFKSLKMDLVTAGGMPFTTQTEGVGDIGLSGFYSFYNSERKVYSGRPDPASDDSNPQGDCWNNCWDELRQAYIGLCLHLPTGSIDERGATPMNANAKLPYPMQLGSGTYDLEPCFVYQSISEKWAVGIKTALLLRLGENKYDYALGDRFTASIWASRKLSERCSLDLRLDEIIWDDIHGADPELNPMMVPTARADLRGGNRLDFWLGTTYYIPEGKLEGNRLHIEFGLPLHQSLNGPQLETNWLLQASWSWTY